MIKKVVLTLVIIMLCTGFSLPVSASGTSLTIEDCIKLAEGNNIQFKQQDLELFIANLNLSLAKSNRRFESSATLTVPDYSFYKQPQFYPGFPYKFIYEQEQTEFKGEVSLTQPLPTNGSVSVYSYFRDQDSNYNIYDDEHEFTSNTGITLRQPLFKVNTLKVAVDKAEIEYQRVQNSYDEVKQNIRYDVKKKFYNVLYSNAQVEIDRENVTNSEYILNITNEKIIAGLLPEIDRLTVEVELANNTSQLFEAEMNMENKKNELKRYLNIPLGEEITVQGEILIEQDFSYSISELEQFALNNRADLKNTKLRRKLLELDLKEARYQKRITADIVANYGYEGRGEDISEAMETFESNRWGIGLTINIPIFDSGRKNKTIQSRELSIKSIDLQIEDLEQALLFSIRTNYIILENARNRLNLLEKNKEQARENLGIIQMKYQLGIATLEQVKAAQLSLQRAELNELKAIVDYNNSINQLKIEVGI